MLPPPRAASIVRIVTLIYESDSLWIQAENSLKDYAANSLYPRQHHEYEGFDEGTPEESAVPAAAGKDQAALQKSAEGEAEQGQKDEEKGLVLEQEEEQIFREVLSELLSS